MTTRISLYILVVLLVQAKKGKEIGMALNNVKKLTTINASLRSNLAGGVQPQHRQSRNNHLELFPLRCSVLLLYK